MWIDGVTYAFGLSDDRLQWIWPTRGAPTTVTPGTLITAANVDGGLILFDSSTGKTTRTFPTAARVTTGTRAYQFGTGFVVAESATTVYR